MRRSGSWCVIHRVDRNCHRTASNGWSAWHRFCGERLSCAAGVRLTERVRETWWLLGGPACVSTAADHADAESFFDHLAQHEERTRSVADIAAFEASLVRLYAAPDTQASDRLQVMTIHRAKGLEFDYVIVPGLDRVTMGDDAQLMQWLERPSESGRPSCC